MQKILSVALLCALLDTTGAMAAPSPAPRASALPEIYHSYSSPLCSALRTKIAPTIAMLQQNDVTIAKSNTLFKRYIQDTISDSKSSQDFAVVQLGNLVRPLVDNILATQKLLEDPSVFPANPQTDEEKRQTDLRTKALAALAAQQAALDIINGFVDTQQLAGMQHDGLGYISAITGTGMTQSRTPISNVIGGSSSNVIGGGTPDPLQRPPLFDNTAINAGLTPNPYEYNLPNIPGLALGYNPVSRLREGGESTQSEGGKSEQRLAKTVIETAKMCGARDQSASPSP